MSLKIHFKPLNIFIIILSPSEYSLIFSDPQGTLPLSPQCSLYSYRPTLFRALMRFSQRVYSKFVFALSLSFTPWALFLSAYRISRFTTSYNRLKHSCKYVVHWNATLRRNSHGLKYFDLHLMGSAADPHSFIPDSRKCYISSRDFTTAQQNTSTPKLFDFIYIGNPTFNKNVYNFLEASSQLYNSRPNIKTCTFLTGNYSKIIPPLFIDPRLIVPEKRHIADFPFNRRILLSSRMKYPGLHTDLVSLLLRSSRYLVLFSEEEGEPRVIKEAHALNVPTIVNRMMFGSVHSSCTYGINTLYSKSSSVQHIRDALEESLDLVLPITFTSSFRETDSFDLLATKLLTLIDPSNNSHSYVSQLSSLLSQLNLIHTLPGHSNEEFRLQSDDFSISSQLYKSFSSLMRNL